METDKTIIEFFDSVFFRKREKREKHGEPHPWKEKWDWEKEEDDE